MLCAKCCRCESEAPYTAKIVNSGPLIDVGQADKYKPVCLKHWLENNKNFEIHNE